jgi:hypothetical protein
LRSTPLSALTTTTPGPHSHSKGGVAGLVCPPSVPRSL